MSLREIADPKEQGSAPAGGHRLAGAHVTAYGLALGLESQTAGPLALGRSAVVGDKFPHAGNLNGGLNLCNGSGTRRGAGRRAVRRGRHETDFKAR